MFPSVITSKDGRFVSRLTPGGPLTLETDAAHALTFGTAREAMSYATTLFRYFVDFGAGDPGAIYPLGVEGHPTRDDVPTEPVEPAYVTYADRAYATAAEHGKANRDENRARNNSRAHRMNGRRFQR